MYLPNTIVLTGFIGLLKNQAQFKAKNLV